MHSADQLTERGRCTKSNGQMMAEGSRTIQGWPVPMRYHFTCAVSVEPTPGCRAKG